MAYKTLLTDAAGQGRCWPIPSRWRGVLMRIWPCRWPFSPMS